MTMKPRTARARRDSRRTLGRSAATAVLLLLMASVLAGCSSQSGNVVSIHDLKFDPQTITVNAGASVTWVNNDQTAHTITSDSIDSTSAPAAAQFNTPPFDPGTSQTLKFDTPGTYPYHCTIHPYIKGRVIVR